jgi:acetolactate synthase-1/3 small subunit
MNMVRTFIVYVADHPGVLNRVSSLFRRRGYNIESLTVGHTQVPEVSRMTVAVTIDERGAPLVRANLYKLAEVLNVEDITDVSAFHREMVLLKVAASQKTQPELMRVLEAFRARVLEVSAESLVVEATGPEEEIDNLVEAVRPFGILEMTRTGGVAMKRGSAHVLKRHSASDAKSLSPTSPNKLSITASQSGHMRPEN